MKKARIDIPFAIDHLRNFLLHQAVSSGSFFSGYFLINPVKKNCQTHVLLEIGVR
tara:strand:- start:250 stop:414 length:165 start_codon:yes stop_codon:yes gene_type:complete